MAVGGGKMIVSVAKSSMPAPSSAAMGSSTTHENTKSSSLVRLTQMPRVSKDEVLVFLGGNKLVERIHHFVVMPAFQRGQQHGKRLRGVGTKNETGSNESSHALATAASNITNTTAKASAGTLQELGSYAVTCHDDAAARRLIKKMDKKMFQLADEVRPCFDRPMTVYLTLHPLARPPLGLGLALHVVAGYAFCRGVHVL